MQRAKDEQTFLEVERDRQVCTQQPTISPHVRAAAVPRARPLVSIPTSAAPLPTTRTPAPTSPTALPIVCGGEQVAPPLEIIEHVQAKFHSSPIVQTMQHASAECNLTNPQSALPYTSTANNDPYYYPKPTPKPKPSNMPNPCAGARAVCSDGLGGRLASPVGHLLRCRAGPAP